MRRFRLAVLGGTFDHLHIGHHALLASAFRVGEEVAIGLTTDRFVSDHPKPEEDRIQRFSVRRAALERWLHRNTPGRRWRIVSLSDPFGRSVDPEVGVLVVSEETLAGGRAVNRERRRLGRSLVPLVVVPLVLGDDLEPVSSRRVRAGVIGPDGRRRAAIRVRLVVEAPQDQGPARRAVRRVFARGRFTNETGPEAADILVRVSRRRTGGWTASEASPRVRLQPRRVPGSRPSDLERGLVALLRPREERKLFGALGPSHR